MKRFIFRLQKVMELRKWRERFSQQKLSKAQHDRETARKELQESLTDVSNQHENQKQRINSGIKAGDALAEARYTQRLLKEAALREREVEHCELAVEEHRDDLVEKSRERKILEKLRERQLNEHSVEAGRREQKSMDDDAARRHHNILAGKVNNGS